MILHYVLKIIRYEFEIDLLNFLCLIIVENGDDYDYGIIFLFRYENINMFPYLIQCYFNQWISNISYQEKNHFAIAFDILNKNKDCKRGKKY